MQPMNKKALAEAVKAAGGRRALADALNVSESSVIKWERGERTPLPNRAVLIERLFGVKRARLMPDIFA